MPKDCGIPPDKHCCKFMKRPLQVTTPKAEVSKFFMPTPELPLLSGHLQIAQMIKLHRMHSCVVGMSHSPCCWESIYFNWRNHSVLIRSWNGRLLEVHIGAPPSQYGSYPPHGDPELQAPAPQQPPTPPSAQSYVYDVSKACHPNYANKANTAVLPSLHSVSLGPWGGKCQ